MQERIKKHLKKKYYKDDKKVITIHVDEENELYNKLDMSKETLSEAVTDYLEKNAETLLPLSEVTIAIDCPKEVDLNRFKESLQLHYGISIMNADRLINIVKRKKWFLLASALVAFLLSYWLKEFVADLFSFIGSLAIWEFCDILVFEDEKDTIMAYVYEVLESANVIKNDESLK